MHTRRRPSSVARAGDVDFLGSILVPADETVFCLFEAGEEDVRAVSERAGVPLERVRESLRIDGTQMQEEEDGGENS